MSGAGSGPAGSTPGGMWVPAPGTNLGPQPAPLGVAQGRALDPATGEVLLNDNGQPLAMSGVQQRVWLAMRTNLGSAADPLLGNQFREIKDITANVQRHAEALANQALKTMIDASEITIESVSLERTGVNRIELVIRWTDISTGQTQVTNA